MNKEETMGSDLIGKSVMIRTYSAGVHYGELNKIKDEGSEYSVKLIESTRVYSWAGANSLSQLASEGTQESATKLSVTLPSIYLKAIEVIEMTDKAVKALNKLKIWRYDRS